MNTEGKHITHKRFLFFIVHPSKYHVFKHTINILKSNGHHVDIIITSKDVLEELIQNEGWAYKNIFPKGRKIAWLPTFCGAAVNALITLIRLELFLFSRSKYDLFITDDLLALNGRLHGVPSIVFQDDDVTAVPETAVLHKFCSHILSPAISDMGKYQSKKIPFYGYKELGSFHPARFKPDLDIVKQFNPDLSRYFLLRLVLLKSTHDVGKSGLNNKDVVKLISTLESNGKVFITSERKLPPVFEKYRIPLKANEVAHALYYAEFLIADSQTMSAESAILGTPYIRVNDFVGKIGYLNELENKYELGYGISTEEKNRLFIKVDDLLAEKDLKNKWHQKRDAMLSEKIDLTSLMVWLFENYPESVQVLEGDPGYQTRFK